MNFFDYTNRGPLPWGIVRTNRITLRVADGCVEYTRQYHGKKGLSSGISHTFEPSASADEIAKGIHWGCCGWSAGGHEIYTLRDKVTEFLSREGL